MTHQNQDNNNLHALTQPKLTQTQASAQADSKEPVSQRQLSGASLFPASVAGGLFLGSKEEPGSLDLTKSHEQGVTSALEDHQMEGQEGCQRQLTAPPSLQLFNMTPSHQTSLIGNQLTAGQQSMATGSLFENSGLQSSSLWPQQNSNQLSSQQPSLPRAGSHNDIVQGAVNHQNERNRILGGSTEEEEIKDHQGITSNKKLLSNAVGMRPGGIKGVQSLQNLTSYAKEEMTRVVSERTVCYCSNFDLDAAEWYRQYATLKNFPQILHKKLDESWHEYLASAVSHKAAESSNDSVMGDQASNSGPRNELFKQENEAFNRDVSTLNQNDSLGAEAKTNLESGDQCATSSLFKLLHDFYVLRNFQEPAQASSNQTGDQKFNCFLQDARQYFEGTGNWRVNKEQLFRQLVFAFYEEAEFAQQELLQVQKSTQIRLTEQALKQFSSQNRQKSGSFEQARVHVTAQNCGLFGNQYLRQPAHSITEDSPSEVPMSCDASQDRYQQSCQLLGGNEAKQQQETDSQIMIGTTASQSQPKTQSARQDQFVSDVAIRPVNSQANNATQETNTPALASHPSFVQSYSSWASYLPGISIIRNHVINPLLVATEKVVEQYIPVQAAQDTTRQVFPAVNQTHETEPVDTTQSQNGNSLRMLNNLRMDQSDMISQASSNNNLNLGAPLLSGSKQDMRQRMQNLTINDLRSDFSISSKQSKETGSKRQGQKQKLKKRRFREFDNAWELNIDEGSQSLIATHKKEALSDETLSLSSSQRNGKNRRCIKLNYKKINRICAEMDIARGCSGGGMHKGIKEQAKIMGSFAILMYDLQTDNLHRMKDQDQAAIRDQMMSTQPQSSKKRSSCANFDQASQRSSLRTSHTSFESVDSVRFLKTNVAFYERAILVWIKFKILNGERLQLGAKVEQFALLQEFTGFLRGFLAKNEKSWSSTGSCGGDSLLAQATQLIASIILTQHFASLQQFEQDFKSVQSPQLEVAPMELEDAFMQLFFANVHTCLLKKWETFVVEQSAKFKAQHKSAMSNNVGQPAQQFQQSIPLQKHNVRQY